jgi:cellobiose-specific phosphotransferase system component IIA
MTDTKQPEALRLADELESEWFADYDIQNAADELRRLHEVNTELVSLLKRYRSEIPLGHQPHMIAAEVDEALAKAEVTK